MKAPSVPTNANTLGPLLKLMLMLAERRARTEDETARNSTVTAPSSAEGITTAMEMVLSGNRHSRGPDSSGTIPDPDFDAGGAKNRRTTASVAQFDGASQRGALCAVWSSMTPGAEEGRLLLSGESFIGKFCRTYANAGVRTTTTRRHSSSLGATTHDHKEVTMKSQLRFASLSLFAILCLAVAAVPAAADNTLYSNGPVNGTGNAWSIGGGTGGGSVVSDSTSLNSSRSNVYGIQFGTWEFPGDTLTSVDWSITGSENGGTVYGSGTASGANLTDTFISSNQYGYNIDLITVSGLDVSLNAGTYWLNLQNAVSAQGNPVFWDENSGPSQASESALGTIPSESFDLYGSTGNGSGTTPEPGTLILFGSGVLGLATATRKRREG